MNGGDLQGVADRIRRELKDLERVVNRIAKGWEFAVRGEDDIYMDSVAFNLHGFYTGLERIFSVIAEYLDGRLPQGAFWHQQLLEQMTTANPPFRPAVLSLSVGERLNDFRGFRHVVRNVYYYRLDPKRIERLVNATPGLYAQLSAELLAFAAFLEARQP